MTVTRQVYLYLIQLQLSNLQTVPFYCAFDVIIQLQLAKRFVFLQPNS